ncbi:MAG: hypothetical protein WC466_09155 [Candidatus Izemoplasmatales bacterium]
MTSREEKEIRVVINSIVDDMVKKQIQEFEKTVIKSIRDSEKYQKKEFDSFISELKKELQKKYLTKKEIKDLMIQAFVKQNKFMWEKSKFITSYFNEL